jgi:thioredoxin reductase (NADPH)
VSIRSLDCSRADGVFALATDCGKSMRAKSVVVASGARYRRPEVPRLSEFEGRGVWYWASALEAKMCSRTEVALVGGGNSAGQAAVFLAGHAKKVWMLVRGAGLAASMSKYLIDRIASMPNIELRTRTEIVGLEGTRQAGVESIRWRNRDTGAKETHAIRNVFLFLGADPTTEWLAPCGVKLDDKGFVVTGDGSERHPLETSVPGVFAIGDVRAGSTKRVGAAIGEGAAVVAQIHAYLARTEDAPAAAYR